jgi:NADPH2:quinone reductase
MQAILVDRTGGPEALRFGETAAPRPGPGQVSVRLAAIGVNFIDVYFRTGAYKAPGFPFTPGMEGAGTVVETGDGVTAFAAGDRVAYAQVLGSYAEIAIVPAEKLARVPDGVSFDDAAAVMLQGMTAEYLSHSTYPLKAGDVAVVHAGAGGAGLLLTQMAKLLGATVITTVSTEEKAALSREAGADHTILYTHEDFAAEVRRITAGRGADVVYDSVGRDTFEKSLDSLRPRGMLVLFGQSSGQVPPFDLQQLNSKGSLYVTRPTLGNYISDPREFEQRASTCFRMIRDGTLQLRIGARFPLADAAAAHRALEGRRTTGKVLLVP